MFFEKKVQFMSFCQRTRSQSNSDSFDGKSFINFGFCEISTNYIACILKLVIIFEVFAQKNESWHSCCLS